MASYACEKCKKRHRVFMYPAYKEDRFLGFNHLLKEWNMFSEDNLTAKAYMLSGYLTDVVELNEELWNDIRYSCRRCIKKYMKKHLRKQP